MPETAEQRVTRLERLLAETMNQLFIWSSEAVGGGWSTQHVEPMRKWADKIHREVQQ